MHKETESKRYYKTQRKNISNKLSPEKITTTERKEKAPKQSWQLENGNTKKRKLNP